jgi:hypothetical protein
VQRRARLAVAAAVLAALAAAECAALAADSQAEAARAAASEAWDRYESESSTSASQAEALDGSSDRCTPVDGVVLPPPERSSEECSQYEDEGADGTAPGRYIGVHQSLSPVVGALAARAPRGRVAAALSIPVPQREALYDADVSVDIDLSDDELSKQTKEIEAHERNEERLSDAGDELPVRPPAQPPVQPPAPHATAAQATASTVHRRRRRDAGERVRSAEAGGVVPATLHAAERSPARSPQRRRAPTPREHRIVAGVRHTRREYRELFGDARHWDAAPRDVEALEARVAEGAAAALPPAAAARARIATAWLADVLSAELPAGVGGTAAVAARSSGDERRDRDSGDGRGEFSLFTVTVNANLAHILFCLLRIVLRPRPRSTQRSPRPSAPERGAG